MFLFPTVFGVKNKPFTIFIPSSSQRLQSLSLLTRHGVNLVIRYVHRYNNPMTKESRRGRVSPLTYIFVTIVNDHS